MPRHYKPKPRKNVRHISYNKEDIERALKDKRINNISYRAAAAKHNIDFSVLHKYATRIDVKKKGGQLVLGSEVEDIIIENINACCELGYPMKQYDIRLLVKIYLDKKGIQSRFKNNMPGIDFVGGFLKRHKDKLSERYAQNRKRVRANISARTINNYFNGFEKTLKNVQPTNIINYDEFNFSDDPGREHAIVKRVSKYPEPECSISIMMAGTADGYLFPPYVIYKAQHIYNLWKIGGPEGTVYNRTSSGWIDIITFEDWIQTVIVPYSKKIEGTLYLIGDNLSCHLSIDAIKICKEHNIFLVFLPPNTTHLTQPLDVAFFRPFIVAWRRILLLWKKKAAHKGKFLPKSKFPRLLNHLLSKIKPNTEANLRAGFIKTGIYPLNRQEVLSRLLDSKQTVADASMCMGSSESVSTKLKSVRDNEEEQPVKKRKKLNVAPGKSVAEEILGNSYENQNQHNDTGTAFVKKMDDDAAGPSNFLMCQVCNCLKIKNESWIPCNTCCTEQICSSCAGDVLPIEFICTTCFQADSEDGAELEDYKPVTSEAYDYASSSSYE